MRLKVKITKTRLKQIIEEELKVLSESVIDVDFDNKRVMQRREPEGEIPLEKTIAAMLSDMRERAQDISELSRGIETGYKIEADMLEVIAVIDELELEL